MSREVIELRAAIAKLTGRLPVSHDKAYLARRLADLRSIKASDQR